MSKRNDDDFFDQLFTRLQDGDFINKTVNDFGKEIKNTVNRSIKNQGYDNFSDMVNSTIRAQPAEKPSAGEPLKQHVDYQNRYEFLVDSLQFVKYDPRYRGYYRDGHQEAIQKCVSWLSDSNNDFDGTEDYIEKEIQTFLRRQRRNRDKFIEGYLDGLHLFKDELNKSKVFMMSKVKKMLVNK
ncbi:MAG: hypothetical protein VB012_03125 [Erysipelotrichaceae bacterium]|nr:hypothetical protein [Erysipelotrichaceae bacterium]